MSETETTKSKSSLLEMRKTNQGLMQFRATFDGVTVREAYGGVYLRLYRGHRDTSMTLTPDQARHVARRLTHFADLMEEAVTQAAEAATSA